MSESHSTITYRNIPGFPGYRVGDDGSVWSCWVQVGPKKAVMSGEWKQKRARTNHRGYKRVHLSVAGKKNSEYVHRLVLLAFVGPCPDGMECLHGPGGPGDNQPNNLRWGTHGENIQDTINADGFLKGEKRPQAKLTAEQVVEIRRLSASGVGANELARRFGIRHGTVGNITRGRTWKHLLTRIA